jgi:ribose transport system permease protein
MFILAGDRTLVANSPLSVTPAGDPVGSVPTPGEGRSGWLLARVDLLLRLGLLGIIIIAAAFFAIKTIPSGNLSDINQSIFMSVGNLQDIGRQMAVTGVIALGETFVIITAGIDLSVGSLIGMAGMLTASAFLANWPTPIVIIAIMLFGLAIGLFNGSLVAFAGIPPFIVTLGMLGILRGAAYLESGGLNYALSPSGNPTPFTSWIESTFLGIPNIFVVLLLVGVLSSIFLRFTRRGRYIYAVGSNPESARRSGIHVQRILLLVYGLSGVLAAVAGLLLTGRLGTANPASGTSYELDAIAAAVLGGASLFGAHGSIVGTFLGVVLVNMLSNGISLINIDPHMQQVIEGILLILVVWVDQWRKRRIIAS